MECLELDFADTAAANADDGGDILLDLVLLELGVVVVDFDLPADGGAKLLLPACLVIGGLPLLLLLPLLGLLAFLFNFFEVEEEDDDEDVPAAIAAGLDPPPPPLSLPFSFTLSLMAAVVAEPLTRGVEGTLKGDAEE